MMNPATVVIRLMTDSGLTPATLAVRLDVPVSVVASLLNGNSPDVRLYGPLADALGVSDRFIRALYSKPSLQRDIALSAVLRKAA